MKGVCAARRRNARPQCGYQLRPRPSPCRPTTPCLPYPPPINPRILLVVAGILESVWVIGLKKNVGFTRLWPSVITIATMILSSILLARAMAALHASIAYVVWVGISAVGAAVRGLLVLGERLTLAQVACIAAIALGIAGLKAFSTPGPKPLPAPSATGA